MLAIRIGAVGPVIPFHAALKPRFSRAEWARGFLPVKGRSRMSTISIDDVQPRAQAALTNSPFYELRELQVGHQNGALLISGVVSSFYHKQLAQEVVRSVCKNLEIINTIHVTFEEEMD
jgi:hypothetical protein